MPILSWSPSPCFEYTPPPAAREGATKGRSHSDCDDARWGVRDMSSLALGGRSVSWNLRLLLDVGEHVRRDPGTRENELEEGERDAG